MSELYTVKVFNTITSSYEEIHVSKEVYNEYHRSKWRMDKNDEKHRTNEIPFCALIGAEDGEADFFKEFTSDADDPAKQLMAIEAKKQLHHVIVSLPKADQTLIRALFFCGLSEKQYADVIGVKQQTVHKKKERILKMLRKVLR